MSTAGRFKWLAAMVVVMVMAVGAWAQQSSPYFTGDGGKGIRLAVLEPAGKGLSTDDQWMLSLVQGSITGDFNKFSGMTIIDRQNLEKVIGEWKEATSGKYSDADYVKIGNLTNASHILTGNISKTANAIMIEFSVTDLQSGERKASYSPKPVSALALENLSAVKEAAADLLTQLGVKLTSAALAELKRTENIAKIQAESMLARGITAQRQGTEVAALSYFFQAAALDPSLLEATNRSSVMAANISSGNIGADARNDIAWRKAWIARLEEAERYFDNLNKTVSMPYTLFYSDEIIQGAINYQNETMSLNIKTYLHGSAGIKVWALSAGRALQAIHDGLEATKRKTVWGLDNWPGKRVTDLNPFTKQSRKFTVAVELVNSRNQVIGRQEFQTGCYWEYSTGGRFGVNVSSDGKKLVSFTNVKADDITDNLTIRFASVNGETAETAARKGVLQIRAMPKGEFDVSVQCAFASGEIKKYNVAGSNIVIPNAVWGDRVTSIGDNVFAKSKLTGVTIPAGVTSIGKGAFAHNNLSGIVIPSGVTSIGEKAFYSNNLTGVTIPNSVTSIGDGAFGVNGLTSVTIPKGVTSIGQEAFAYNKLSSIVIPNSVTSIGKEAFSNNMLSSITIGENVTFGQSAFDIGFEETYKNRGRMAGTYIYIAEFKVWRFNEVQTPIDMVLVEGGTFTMGCTETLGKDCESNEKPAHKVTVGDFYIATYEVTQMLWLDVMGSNPSKIRGRDLPVGNVNLEDVITFLIILNKITGLKYRLPTEAEWEFAARGGNKSNGYKFSGSNNIGNVAWYDGNSGDKPHPVGTKQPNELGLYDMSGNAVEIVGDWDGNYDSNAQTNPKGPVSSSFRVGRGGSFNHAAGRCRVSYRSAYAQTFRTYNIGFRLAHDAE